MKREHRRFQSEPSVTAVRPRWPLEDMPDRRTIAARCALIMSLGSVAMSIWFFNVNARVMDALGKNQAIPNPTAFEVYMYIYSCWGGPSFFVFLGVWMRIAKPHLQIKRLPGSWVWWVSFLFFAMFIPTVLLPVSAIGLWAICTRGNKELIETAIREARRPTPHNAAEFGCAESPETWD